MQTIWGAATDAGGYRQVNEDAVLATPPVFLVADGMGGHVYGALASASVVRAFEEFAAHYDPDEPVEPAQILTVITRAQELIRTGLQAGHTEEPQHAQQAGDSRATPAATPLAGSTVAGAVLTTRHGAPYWLVFNVGDSRIYRYDEDGLTQISVDHSVVQELLDSGTITAEAARTHPERNVITRAVDTNHTAEVDFWMLHAGGPQRLLLCSDGLTGELTAAEITQSLAGRYGPERTCLDLLHRATDGGARDNVSVVVVDLLSDDTAEVTAPRAGTGSAEPVDLPDDLDDTLPRAGADALR